MFTNERRELDALKGMKVTSLSGIAAPAGFEKSIETFGADLLERHRFADHHRYTQQELINIINTADELGADAIITTEKDAVRFPNIGRRDVPIYYMRVDIEILSGAQDFKDSIAHICFRDVDNVAAA